MTALLRNCKHIRFLIKHFQIQLKMLENFTIFLFSFFFFLTLNIIKDQLVSEWSASVITLDMCILLSLNSLLQGEFFPPNGAHLTVYMPFYIEGG